MLKNINTGFLHWSTIPTPLRVVANSYSDLFFVQGWFSGCILLFLTFLNPNVAIAGLISVLAAYVFAVFLGYKAEFLRSGFYTYNCLLVGLAIGHILQLTWITLIFLLISSALTFIITIVSAHILSYYFGLQILSIPFVMVSSLVYLAARRFPNLYVTGLYSHPFYQDFLFFPDWINGFFKALGAIIFMPHTVAGLVVAVLILLSSRILFFLAVLGFITGSVIKGVFIGSVAKAMMDVNSFNYILIAMAIGGINVVPSFQSYVLAIVAVAMSTLLTSSVDVFWSQFGIPVFTLPFVIITLSFTYVLGLVQYRLRPVIHKKNPEQTLDYFLTSKDRFSPEITISMPCAGNWTVWQGFEGGWTHQGIWKYAMDFVMTDLDGHTFKNKGVHLDDYYCFGKPVLSAVQGRVVKVVNTCEDNVIGTVDDIHNWGNMVLIHSNLGYFVEISHFAKGSICVNEGEWVEPGVQIGLCGNSGYSPQPHIHIQVQATADMGSATIPFRFHHYIESKTYRAHGRPAKGTVVSSAVPQPFYDQLTTFILDTEHSFEVFYKKKPLGQLDIVVKMALDGTFYLSSSRGQLYFGKQAGTFYLYHMNGDDRLLRLFYLCLSSMPLHYEPGLSWTDTLSTTTLLTGLQKMSASLLNAITPNVAITKVTYTYMSELEISGCIKNDFFSKEYSTYLRFNTERQIDTLIFDNYELKRINHSS